MKGEVKGISSGKISKYIRNFMIKQAGYKCSVCEWNKVNEYTNTLPLEIDHIDGNADNNTIDNLRVLCPNCHALTNTYKGANRGNGRVSRRKRYQEGKSY